MIICPIGTTKDRLVFTDPVLRYFENYRQLRWYQREAGGQLFAEFSGHEVKIVKATGPRWTDRRTRHTYEPDRKAEQREIDRFHASGLHFVGDWHTHAEPIPSPSPVDRQSMTEAFQRSRHALNAFVMVIVGQINVPDGLFISLCDKDEIYPIRPL